MSTSRIDLKQELKHLYQTSAKEVVQVVVPTFQYLMVDGTGDPNTSAHYQKVVEALFSVSYTAKFILKKGPIATDYAVMPLEGLWWADDMSAFVSNDRSQWQWTMMIMQPHFVTQEVLHMAIDEVKTKKKIDAVSKLRIENFTEGLCAQILHIGPFITEGPTIQKVHDFIDSKSERSGKHHEIYLSDIRRAAPSKWKTIIRHPMIATST